MHSAGLERVDVISNILYGRGSNAFGAAYIQWIIEMCRSKGRYSNYGDLDRIFTLVSRDGKNTLILRSKEL